MYSSITNSLHNYMLCFFKRLPLCLWFMRDAVAANHASKDIWFPVHINRANSQSQIFLETSTLYKLVTLLPYILLYRYYFINDTQYSKPPLYATPFSADSLYRCWLYQAFSSGTPLTMAFDMIQHYSTSFWCDLMAFFLDTLQKKSLHPYLAPVNCPI